LRLQGRTAARPLSAILFLSLAGQGCAPTAMEPPVNASQIEPRRRTVYSLDWRAQVQRDSVEEPPLKVLQSRYEPLETVAPLVVALPSGIEIVAGSSSGAMIAVDTRGKKRWDILRPGGLHSGLAAREGKIYFGCADGTVTAIDAENGHELWTYNTSEEPGTAPVFAGGLVLVSTHEQTLFALDVNTGQWRWQYHRDQSSEFTIRGVSTPLVVNDRIYTGFADGTVMCLRLSDGTVLWQTGSSRREPYLDAESAPQTDGQRIFATSYRDGLIALSPEKGEVLWQKTFPQVNHLTFSHGTLYATAVGKVAAFAPTDGTQLWSKGTEFRTATGVEVWKGLLMVPTDGPLFFLDGRTGRPLGDSFNPGRGISAVPTIFGRDMYVMSNAGWLYAMSLR
jgi:outer membrane protein assembly factor BamB